MYKDAFNKAFQQEPNLMDMAKAMEQFMLSMVSQNSKFNAFFPGKFSILSEEEKRGAILFMGSSENRLRKIKRAAAWVVATHSRLPRVVHDTRFDYLNSFNRRWCKRIPPLCACYACFLRRSVLDLL